MRGFCLAVFGSAGTLFALLVTWCSRTAADVAFSAIAVARCNVTRTDVLAFGSGGK